MRTQVLSLLAGLVLALACAPARAQNPRVSLSLPEASAAEAMAALGRAAGVPLDLGDPARGGDAQLEERLGARANFRWENVSFARALRELCARYRLRPVRRPAGGYTLHVDRAAPLPPERRVGLAEKDGVRAFVRRISISSSRQINFDRDPVSSSPGQMTLHIAGELLDGDTVAIAGLDNVAAKDDLGNLLAPDPIGIGVRWWGSDGDRVYPDEWSGPISLPAPHPKARKLLWVEGDLVVYGTYRLFTVDVPLPVPPGGARKQEGGATVEVLRHEPAPPQNQPPVNPPGEGHTLQVRISLPPDSGITLRDAGRAVVLVGASGRVHSPAGGGGGGGGGTFHYDLTFRGIPEPVVAARFPLVEKRDPKRLASFRIADIPLPGDAPNVPRRTEARRAAPPRAAPPRAAPQAPPAERPFFDRSGGKLVNRVRIGDQPAPEGTLSLGLAERVEGDWSGVRWLEVPVRADGTAVLEYLRPGTYRLLRLYRMKEAPRLHADGRWENSEVVIQVAAGKETAASPLVWTPEPEEGAPGAEARGSKPPLPAARPQVAPRRKTGR